MNSKLLYIWKRLLLMVPTLLGITTLNFFVMQMAPGGPVESIIAQMRFSGTAQTLVTQEVRNELNKLYGYDKPLITRYGLWLKALVKWDFGWSHSYGKPVTKIIASKLPVSIRFGIFTFLLTYLICIPLGVFKALHHKSFFDGSTTFFIVFLYSLPSFVFALALIVLLAGGSYWNVFPMGGIRTLDSQEWPFWQQLKDQAWHMVLPLCCFLIHNFALVTLLMKNSLMDVLGKDFMRTALAKGHKRNGAVLRHGLRNAVIPLVPGFGTLLTALVTSNLLIERIFNLDGFGKLFFDAALQRDYPILMAQVVMASVLALLGQLISDLLYMWVDPRITLA